MCNAIQRCLAIFFPLPIPPISALLTLDDGLPRETVVCFVHASSETQVTAPPHFQAQRNPILQPTEPAPSLLRTDGILPP